MDYEKGHMITFSGHMLKHKILGKGPKEKLRAYVDIKYEKVTWKNIQGICRQKIHKK